MKKLLPLLGLLASVCRPCTKLPLSAEDRTWTAAYPRVGQEITFRSDRGHVAVYRVAERLDTYSNLDCNWLEIGTSQPAHFHMLLRPTAFPQGGAHDLTLYVVKWSAGQPAQLDFRMAGLEAYIHERNDQHHFRLQPRACTLASGQRFPQAYYFEAGRNAIAYGTPPLRAWSWDPQAGLLRYELADGEAVAPLVRLVAWAAPESAGVTASCWAGIL